MTPVPRLRLRLEQHLKRKRNHAPRLPKYKPGVAIRAGIETLDGEPIELMWFKSAKAYARWKRNRNIE